MTLLREARKWWNLEIENEGDLLDIVIERPEDLDLLTFNWKTIGFDMANDGLVGSPSDAALNDQMEFLARTLPHLDNLNLTLFPSPLAFLTFQGLTTTPAGRELLAPRIKSLKIQACHPSHLGQARQLLEHCKGLEQFTLEHLQLPGHAHHVVNLDTRELLSWLPSTVTTLKVRGFHLLQSQGGNEEHGGVSYPSLKVLEVVFCGASDSNLLHLACLCPSLTHFTVVVSMTPPPGPGPQPQAPQQGMVASHLHSLCHNPSLVQCTVLVKVGEGWIQIDDRDMLGELVLGSSSETLRKIVLFPIRGICGNGLRRFILPFTHLRFEISNNLSPSLVLSVLLARRIFVSTLASATKGRSRRRRIGKDKKNSSLETFFCNRRTSTDEFALLGLDNSCQDYFNDFGSFLDKKISEFEGQFWNDPDWFFGGVWPEPGFDPDIL